MMGEMNFSFADLYPGLKTAEEETSSKATPDKDDIDAMGEDAAIAEKSVGREAKRLNVFLGLGVFVALIVFFGGN